MKRSTRNKIIIILSIIIIILIGIICGYYILNRGNNANIESGEGERINLSNLANVNGTEIRHYKKEDFDSFLSDYKKNFLPEIYITDFLFDGVGMYKPYDLDAFIEGGNDIEVDLPDIKVVNINKTGNIELTGELAGGMIAVNTNDINKDINIILKNVKIDTDSKKLPAIYVYNKDITSTTSKVTIEAESGTKNYIEGGNLKKVSLVGNEDLSNYTNKYSGDASSYYNTYTNYYGVYSNNDIDDILFAKVLASSEDLADGDPYYFYKASGAISSDIDLYFEGEGYLEVKSKNKEGIETKGNLTFSGGIGDYVINAGDDCLNTTTSNSENANARNTLTIDVNSIYAIVSNDADEGDAIDSNGSLVIEGGTIIAKAKAGSDAGIDSESGTYINGGIVLATGDMFDEIKDSSKQNFMVLSFNTHPEENDLITLLDEKNNVVFSYKTDRTFTNLIYSSNTLEKGNYHLYKGGIVAGTENNGFYANINSFSGGIQLGYVNKGVINGMMGAPDNQGDMKEPNENNQTPPDGERPDMNNMMERPENGMMESSKSATNKEFTIDAISNLFSGVRALSE